MQNGTARLAASAAGRDTLPTLLLISWAALLVGWLGYLQYYAVTPGVGDHADVRWPAGTSLRVTPGRPALVVFLHPACPCSPVSLAEYGRLAERLGDRADLRAVFVRPPGVPPGWERTALWSACAVLPRVTVVLDEGGQEARRFGVATSGCTLLYDERGRLVFSGGITPGRGHAGQSAGSAAIVRWFESADAPAAATPVFGCPLLERADETSEATGWQR